MKVNIAREVAGLKRMTVKELRGRYLDVFGETTRSGNKDWLWKRIAWRMQANAEGDLTERARRRAAELAREADLRLGVPRRAEAKAHGSWSRERDSCKALPTGIWANSRKRDPRSRMGRGFSPQPVMDSA